MSDTDTNEFDPKDPDNWVDFGLDEHFDKAEFADWLDIAREAARVAGAEENSPLEGLIFSVAASAARLGYECGECGKAEAPLYGKWDVCKSCAEKSGELPN